MAFASIGELRSLIPSTCGVMALTATATHETFDAVVRRLSMTDVAIVALPPGRTNIKYFVQPLLDLPDLTDLICDDFNKLGMKYPKTVIFVVRIRTCTLQSGQSLVRDLQSPLVIQIYISFAWLGFLPELPL